MPSTESVPALALNSHVAPSLSASMPLLQRTLTGPRPTALVRHASFDSPESLDPNWMNQRIVPVYQLLSGATASSAPSPSLASSTSSLSSSLSGPVSQPSVHAGLKPVGGAAASLVTHSPVNVLKAPATVSLGPSAAKPVVSSAAGPAQIVLPMLGSGERLILRNLAPPGRHQPIVLMPLAASASSVHSPSLVPIQLIADSLFNGGLVDRS